ncbi:MbnP family protein [Agriterribacter sp.]|uniref:MbnP family protein n=1 Tax=Agriterribacter sp. TaxID=2821509 RepID=UPI002CF68856|nr:MbnP family protein [Agriterribacter sp.]HTN05217.1 MbnP family protein [Agriterribacter sp.]
MKTGSGYILCAFLFLLCSCQKELKNESSTGKSYTVHIVLRPVVQGQPLIFNQPYTNAFGEDYTVTAFRFYVSALSLQNNNADVPVAGEAKYRLADAAIGNTLSFTLSANQSIFNSLSFQLGVDSIANVSGAQSGDLDPAKGMFWTWNSGYIMAKLEGASSFSTVPNGSFTYHIGGFSGENKAIRSIVLAVPEGRQIALRNNRTTTVVINADIDKWFHATHALSIADNAFVHSPGSLARLYADNYAAMFSVASITEE